MQKQLNAHELGLAQVRSTRFIRRILSVKGEAQSLPACTHAHMCTRALTCARTRMHQMPPSAVLLAGSLRMVSASVISGDVHLVAHGPRHL